VARLKLSSGRRAWFITSFSVPADKAPLLDEFKQIIKREGLSFSSGIIKAIYEYTHHHRHGNPQTLLAPPKIHPYTNPVTEHRAQLLKDLEATIKANPRIPIERVLAAFAAESGLTLDTIKDYAKTLSLAGRLRR